MVAWDGKKGSRGARATSLGSLGQDTEASAGTPAPTHNLLVYKGRLETRPSAIAALCDPAREVAAAHLSSASPSFEYPEPSLPPTGSRRLVGGEQAEESALMGSTTLCSPIGALYQKEQKGPHRNTHLCCLHGLC